MTKPTPYIEERHIPGPEPKAGIDAAKIAELKRIAEDRRSANNYTWMAPEVVLSILTALEEAQRNAHEQAALVAKYIQKRDTALAERDEARAQATDARYAVERYCDDSNRDRARAEQAEAENKRLREALHKIAAFDVAWPETNMEGYGSMAVVTARAALQGEKAMTDLQQRLTDLAEWAADCGWHNHRKTALDARAALKENEHGK